MAARDILDEVADREDWSLDTQLGLCLEYIENQQSDDAFKDFLQQAADMDEEE